MAGAPKRCAVVTGANKGIGVEICRQLASNDIVVVLTARDENKGLEAIKNLKDSGLPDHLLVFHQLDILDQTSIASLADFVKTHFGKLDILINNAGILGAVVDPHLLRRAIDLCGCWPDAKQANWKEISIETLELAEVCFKTNYYGTKRMVEAFAPLLQLSDSPGIVNVSSSVGLLKNIQHERAKGLLSDVEGLTEQRIEEVVNEFLEDFKNGLIESKGWHAYFSAYFIAKAAVNAYTRILAKKYPNFVVNSLCPGFCRTEITTNLGTLSSAEGAENVVRLALLPKENAPSGCFFLEKQMADF